MKKNLIFQWVLPVGLFEILFLQYKIMNTYYHFFSKTLLDVEYLAKMYS